MLEPPLGFSVDAMEPFGEPFEVAASVAEAAATGANATGEGEVARRLGGFRQVCPFAHKSARAPSRILPQITIRRKIFEMTKQSAFRSYDPLNEDDLHVGLQGQISTSEAIRSILDELNESPWNGESLSIAISCWLTEWQGLRVAAATDFKKRARLAGCWPSEKRR